MVTPYGVQAPEDIAKEYGGNKQKIMAAAQAGTIDPTAAVMAGMFIDRMRAAAQQEAAPAPSTVAQDTFAPPMPPAGGLGAMPQAAPPMPAQMGPQMGAPAPQGMPPAQGGIGGLDFAPAQMASGGIVGYQAGGGIDARLAAYEELERERLDAQRRQREQNTKSIVDFVTGIRLRTPEEVERLNEGRAKQRRLAELERKYGELTPPAAATPAAATAVATPAAATPAAATPAAAPAVATPAAATPAAAPAVARTRTTAPSTEGRRAATRTAAPAKEELDPYSVAEINPSRGVAEQMALRNEYLGEPTYRNQVMGILAERLNPETLQQKEKRDRALFLFELGASLAASKSPYFLQALGESASGAMSKAEEREAARDKAFLDNAMAMADIEGMTRREQESIIQAGVQSETARAEREDVVKSRIAARDLAREEIESKERISRNQINAARQPKPVRPARPEDFISEALSAVQMGVMDKNMQERVKDAGGPEQLAVQIATTMANQINAARGAGSGGGSGQGNTSFSDLPPGS